MTTDLVAGSVCGSPPSTSASSGFDASCSPIDERRTIMMNVNNIGNGAGNRNCGHKRRSPDSSLGTSASELTPSPARRISPDTTELLISPTTQATNTSSSSSSSTTTSGSPTRWGSLTRGSSNYFDDEQVFYNLILRERAELERRKLELLHRRPDHHHHHHQHHHRHHHHDQELMDGLTGEMRHSLLGWMLRVCEHQLCQDEIFPLAMMILEKFLRLNPIHRTRHYFCLEHEAEPATPIGQSDSLLEEPAEMMAGQLIQLQCADDEANELTRRQLCLFAACSLLLATKLRQTRRLYIQTLIDFSRLELPIELSREEILDGELLILSALKWDLAALVTPNDSLQILARKCQNVMAKFLHPNEGDDDGDDDDSNDDDDHGHESNCSDRLATTNEPSETNGSPATKPNNNKCQQQQQREQHQHHHRQQQHEQQQQLEREQRQLKQRHNNRDITAATTTTTTTASGDIAATTATTTTTTTTLINRSDKSRVRRHTQTLLELCLMDPHISQYSASVLAMASMAVAIDGLSMSEKTCWRLNDIVTQIHESTNGVNELKHMIEVAFQIEKYVQKLLHNSTYDD